MVPDRETEKNYVVRAAAWMSGRRPFFLPQAWKIQNGKIIILYAHRYNNSIKYFKIGYSVIFLDGFLDNVYKLKYNAWVVLPEI